VSGHVTRWQPAVALVGDPACSYHVRVTANLPAMLADPVRAHAIRILALAAGHLALAAAAHTWAGTCGGGVGPGISGAVWAIVAAQALATCVSGAGCSPRRHVWHCLASGGAEPPPADDCRPAGAGPPEPGAGWAQREPAWLAPLLVLAAGALARSLAALCRAAGRACSRADRDRRSAEPRSAPPPLHRDAPPPVGPAGAAASWGRPVAAAAGVAAAWAAHPGLGGAAAAALVARAGPGGDRARPLVAAQLALAALARSGPARCLADARPCRPAAVPGPRRSCAAATAGESRGRLCARVYATAVGVSAL
jgi:hypothetical protein